MYDLLLDDDLLIFSLLVSLILSQIKQINWIPTTNHLNLFYAVIYQYLFMSNIKYFINMSR